MGVDISGRLLRLVKARVRVAAMTMNGRQYFLFSEHHYGGDKRGDFEGGSTDRDASSRSGMRAKVIFEFE